LEERGVVGKPYPAAQVWCKNIEYIGVNKFDVRDFKTRQMVLRIASLRDKYKDKTGVVDKVASKVRTRWDGCVGFKIANLRENGRIVTIFRRLPTMSSDPVSYDIDFVQKRRDCGEWQEHGVPCIDAIAYLRLYQNMSLQQILDEHVDRHYTYKHERLLLKNNIEPVCIELVPRDGVTLPPTSSKKRGTGRPQIKRIRERLVHSHEPHKSNIRCSRCHGRGHNVRTCLAREALARQRGEGNVDNVHVLDLE
jgi:hypothetical protein